MSADFSEVTNPGLRALERIDRLEDDVGERFTSLEKRFVPWAWLAGISVTLTITISALVGRAQDSASTTAKAAERKAEEGLSELRREVQELRLEVGRVQRRTEDKVDRVLERLERRK